MTNAEWIRAMSDEELMGWLCDVGACMVDHCVDNRCCECWKDWLAEDADEIKTEEAIDRALKDELKNFKAVVKDH